MMDAWSYLKKRAKELRKESGLRVVRLKCSCIGICSGGPIIGVMPDGVWYGRCTKAVIDRIFTEHLGANQILTDHVIAASHRDGSRAEEA